MVFFRYSSAADLSLQLVFAVVFTVASVEEA